MSDVNYEKQAQDYYSKAPIIILGSGASAAHGMSGMWVSIHRNSIDTGKMRRSSLDPTFLLA
ncbi:hypothetical protein N5D73_04625 [Aeromonas caviae]|nr:hypothetical protein [Aeromonas caviae]